MQKEQKSAGVFSALFFIARYKIVKGRRQCPMTMTNDQWKILTPSHLNVLTNHKSLIVLRLRLSKCPLDISSSPITIHSSPITKKIVSLH